MIPHFYNNYRKFMQSWTTSRPSFTRRCVAGSGRWSPGWFNGRFHKTIGDRYVREAYPIPVISIIGLCDIEVHFDKVSILTRLEREMALARNFDSFVHFDFIARSGDDDTLIFYEPGMTIPEMKKNITDSEEPEVEFEFRFGSDVTGRQIFEFADSLRIDGFYR